jgi:fimbrial chaperone protein
LLRNLSKFGGFCFLFILFFAGIAQASFEFTPILATLTPSGSGASASYQAINSTNGKVAIQIAIVAREPNQKGDEVYKESDEVDEQFKIFPSQLVLNAGESRTVRITYIGPQKFTTEKAFRVLAEELPVDLEDPNKKVNKAVARINITTKYVGSLYVTPAGAAPKVEVEAKASEGAKNQMLVVTVKNPGTAHVMLKSPTLKIQPQKGGTETQLTGTDLKDLAGQNVLAGKSRVFEVPWPKNVPVGAMKASLDWAKE